MKRRQTLPVAWFVADARSDEDLWRIVRSLPGGSGVLVLHCGMAKGKRARLLARLRRIAAGRRLVVADEKAGDSARVHDLAELRSAGLRRVPMVLLSPVFPTASHPDWNPLPRLRAAALLRLAKAPVVALGGMDARRFAKVRPLGFAGWAGIGAWLPRSLHANEFRDVDPRG